VQYEFKSSLKLREKQGLRIFESRFLRRKYEPNKDEIGSGEASAMRNFIV
jgi:hypothetical protein